MLTTGLCYAALLYDYEEPLQSHVFFTCNTALLCANPAFRQTLLPQGTAKRAEEQLHFGVLVGRGGVALATWAYHRLLGPAWVLEYLFCRQMMTP